MLSVFWHTYEPAAQKTADVIILRWFDTLLVHFSKIDTTSNHLDILLAKYVSRLNQKSKSGSVDVIMTSWAPK